MSDANATAHVGATKSALRRTSDRPRSQALKQMDASESLAHRAYSTIASGATAALRAAVGFTPLVGRRDPSPLHSSPHSPSTPAGSGPGLPESIIFDLDTPPATVGATSASALPAQPAVTDARARINALLSSPAAARLLSSSERRHASAPPPSSAAPPPAPPASSDADELFLLRQQVAALQAALARAQAAVTAAPPPPPQPAHHPVPAPPAPRVTFALPPADDAPPSRPHPALAPAEPTWDHPWLHGKLTKQVLSISLGDKTATLPYDLTSSAPADSAVAMLLTRTGDGRVFGSDTAMRQWLDRAPGMSLLAPDSLARIRTSIRRGKLPRLQDLVKPPTGASKPPAAHALHLHHITSAFSRLVSALSTLYGAECPHVADLASLETAEVFANHYDTFVAAYPSDPANQLADTFNSAADAWFEAATRVADKAFDAALDAISPDAPDGCAVQLDAAHFPLPSLLTYFSDAQLRTMQLHFARDLARSSRQRRQDRPHSEREAPSGAGAPGRDRASARPTTDPADCINLPASRDTWPTDVKAAITDKGPKSVRAAFDAHPVLRKVRVDGKELCVQAMLGKSCDPATCPRHHITA